MAYYPFKDEDGGEYGSCEVFHTDGIAGGDYECKESGWYWWACFPGCLPDGEACGPFATEQEAREDAGC